MRNPFKRQKGITDEDASKTASRAARKFRKLATSPLVFTTQQLRALGREGLDEDKPERKRVSGVVPAVEPG
jgi:hypothetical protein